MMTYHSKYAIGDIVYLTTDTDQLERIITRITFSDRGNTVYEVCQGITASSHYEVELSTEKNYKYV